MGASGTVSMIAPLPAGEVNEFETILEAITFANTEVPQSKKKGALLRT